MTDDLLSELYDVIRSKAFIQHLRDSVLDLGIAGCCVGGSSLLGMLNIWGKEILLFPAVYYLVRSGYVPLDNLIYQIRYRRRLKKYPREVKNIFSLLSLDIGSADSLVNAIELYYNEFGERAMDVSQNRQKYVRAFFEGIKSSVQRGVISKGKIQKTLRQMSRLGIDPHLWDERGTVYDSLNIFPISFDPRAALSRALREMYSLEPFQTAHSQRFLRALRRRYGVPERDDAQFDDKIRKLDESVVREVLDEIEEAYLRRGLRTAVWGNLQSRKPRNALKFKLWERTLNDMDIANWAGTCISASEHRFERIQQYMFDPATLMFYIIRKNRPIGHIKVFAGKFEGEPAAHIDYIAISGGRYRDEHDYIKEFGLSAVREHARRAGCKKLSIADRFVNIFRGRLIYHFSIEPFHKIGLDVYEQYLDSPKVVMSL